MAGLARIVPWFMSGQRQTEFLPQRILYDESAGRQALEHEISQIQRNWRRAERSAGMMAFLTALAGSGLGYPAILVENFPRGLPPLMINLVGALGVGSLFGFLAFARLGRGYRKKLAQRKEAYRQKVSTLLESSLGQPLPTPFCHTAQDSTAGDGNDGTARAAGEANALSDW